MALSHLFLFVFLFSVGNLVRKVPFERLPCKAFHLECVSGFLTMLCSMLVECLLMLVECLLNWFSLGMFCFGYVKCDVKAYMPCLFQFIAMFAGFHRQSGKGADVPCSFVPVKAIVP